MVILTDDSPADRALMKKVLRTVCPELEVQVASDGQELIELLQTTHETPQFVLLDLNMPGMCGRGALAALKTNDNFRTIPVVVFTTSSSQKDRFDCLALHANAFVTKPASYSGLKEAAKTLTDFWTLVAAAPTEDVPCFS